MFHSSNDELFVNVVHSSLFIVLVMHRFVDIACKVA